MKIYYSIDTSSVGKPVHWIDVHGNRHIEKADLGRIGPMSSDVDGEFLEAHPGAVYLHWLPFLKRLAQVEMEKKKMNAWNAGVPQ